MTDETGMTDGTVIINRSIDVRKLLYFAAVIQHGSLGKAARSLGLSQPALSVAMDGLEAELGVKLLVRTPRGAAPTERGEALARHSRQVMMCLAAVESEFFGNRTAPKGVLRFGCLPTLAGSVVARAIRHWQAIHPEIELQVTECPQNELLWGLLRRTYDFSVGVVDTDNFAYGLRQRVLFREKLHVVARSGHPLVRKESISPVDLIDYPWVSPTTGWRNTALEHILEPAGLSLRRKVTVCSSIALLKSLIADSQHLALLPAHAVREEVEAGRLVLLEFQQFEMERGIAVFRRDGATLDDMSMKLLQLIQKEGRLADGVVAGSLTADPTSILRSVNDELHPSRYQVPI